MKNTNLEQWLEQIENTYFQKEIMKIYDVKKVNEVILINRIISWTLLGIFCVIAIILLSLMSLVKIENANLIFGLSGGGCFLLALFSAFISPIANFEYLNKKFKKRYSHEIQNDFIKLACSKINLLQIRNVTNKNGEWWINFIYNESKYQMIYTENKLKLFQDNKLINTKSVSHNLCLLIKIYRKDIDKISFTDINSFTLAIEIKIKKIAKLLLSDFNDLLCKEITNETNK